MSGGTIVRRLATLSLWIERTLSVSSITAEKLAAMNAAAWWVFMYAV